MKWCCFFLLVSAAVCEYLSVSVPLSEDIDTHIGSQSFAVDFGPYISLLEQLDEILAQLKIELDTISSSFNDGKGVPNLFPKKGSLKDKFVYEVLESTPENTLKSCQDKSGRIALPLEDGQWLSDIAHEEEIQYAIRPIMFIGSTLLEATSGRLVAGSSFYKEFVTKYPDVDLKTSLLKWGSSSNGDVIVEPLNLSSGSEVKQICISKPEIRSVLKENGLSLQWLFDPSLVDDLRRAVSNQLRLLRSGSSINPSENTNFGDDKVKDCIVLAATLVSSFDDDAFILMRNLLMTHGPLHECYDFILRLSQTLGRGYLYLNGAYCQAEIHSGFVKVTNCPQSKLVKHECWSVISHEARPIATSVCKNQDGCFARTYVPDLRIPLPSNMCEFNGLGKVTEGLKVFLENVEMYHYQGLSLSQYGLPRCDTGTDPSRKLTVSRIGSCATVHSIDEIDEDDGYRWHFVISVAASVTTVISFLLAICGYIFCRCRKSSGSRQVPSVLYDTVPSASSAGSDRSGQVIERVEIRTSGRSRMVPISSDASTLGNFQGFLDSQRA